MLQALGHQLVAVVPVVVGGLLALFGVFLAPALQIKADTKKKREEKFEEMVLALYEDGQWLEAMRNHRIFDTEPRPPGVSPITRAVAMATVNFPELVDKIETFRIASMAYEAWISSAARIRINKTGEISEGHEEMLREYYAGLNSLQGTLKKYAKKNLEFSVMRSGVSLVLRVKMSRTSLRVKRAGEAIPGKEDP